MGSGFPPIRVVPRRPDERIRLGGKDLGACLLDFWRWSGSDLVGNTQRGILAEYLVALALGANDGLRGLPVSQMRKNLDAALSLALENGVRVLLAGMKLPPNYGAEYTRDFERTFPELAAEKKVVLIPFLLKGVAARPEFNQVDGIHPTARGYEIVTETVLTYLRPLL